MAAPTIPVTETSYRILQDLADRTGQTITDVLDKAVDAYHRKLFFDQLNSAYAALRADPVAWAAVEEERRSMDGCLMDGLDPEECWDENGDLLPPREKKANGGSDPG